MIADNHLPSTNTQSRRPKALHGAARWQAGLVRLHELYGEFPDPEFIGFRLDAWPDYKIDAELVEFEGTLFDWLEERDAA